MAFPLFGSSTEKSGDDVRRRGDDPLSYSVRIMTLDMYQMSGLAKEHSNACVSKNYVRQTRCFGGTKSGATQVIQTCICNRGAFRGAITARSVLEVSALLFYTEVRKSSGSVTLLTLRTCTHTHSTVAAR